jgi:arabinan endo-1,5-alpha-L-arabinosidase
MKRDDWYYLFYSGNRCCEYPPHYATMVARSRNAGGPYHRLAEYRPGKSSVIMRDNKRWAGPGHNSVIRDDAGRDWIVFHAIDRNRPYFPGSGGAVQRPMLISRLVYRDGWPRVPTNSPAIRRHLAPYVE